MTADVVVIGGGLSGLAAAVQLSIDGADVVLMEQSGKLGGRAYSYIEAKSGDVVDNGQHALVGAYHNTLRYLEIVGTRRYLPSPKNFQLHFHHKEKGMATFAINTLPFPLNIASGITLFRLLSFHDRRNMFKIGRQLQNWNRQLEEHLRNLTVAEWLETMHQSEESRRSFWHPIAVSVMNEQPEKASALLFARSLKNTFLGNKSDSTVLIPTVGQSDLYVSGAETLLKKQRSKIMLNTEVNSIIPRKGKVFGVRTKNGKHLTTRSVACTVPYFASLRLLPEKLHHTAPFVNFKKFKSSPIVSIHLWFDRAIMDQEFLGLIDRNIQWLFNRRRILHEKNNPENYISAVISGAYKYIDLSKQQLANMAVGDIASAFPAAANASMLQCVVIKEKRATFSPTVEIEPLRPHQQTPVENLFLAGDWTDTGLPPTIEGAVMSGFRCAELIKRS